MCEPLQAQEWRSTLAALIRRLERQGSGGEAIMFFCRAHCAVISCSMRTCAGDLACQSQSRLPLRWPSHACAANFGRTSSSTSVDAGAAADAAAGGGGGGRAGPRQAPIEPGLHAADGSERTLRTWQSVRHVNGVAVYAEEAGVDGEGGALMVSAVVRSSPQECFEVGASCGARCLCGCAAVPLCAMAVACTQWHKNALS